MLFMTVLVIGQKPSGQVLLNPHGLNTEWLYASTLMPGSHVWVPGFPLSKVSHGSVRDRPSFAVLAGILAAVTLLSVMLECYTSASVLFPNYQLVYCFQTPSSLLHAVSPTPFGTVHLMKARVACLGMCIMQWDAFPPR